MQQYWQNKIILITGAGSGIGLALARLMAKNNARLILTDIDKECLQQVDEELKDHIAFSLVADVSRESDWQTLVKRAEQELGHIDVLVNNAGMSSFGYFDETPSELFNKVMDVNFKGVVLGCRHCIPLLEKSERGLIANISSIFGLIGVPLMSPYHASKFAVRGFTEALKQDFVYQRKNIDVICILPGGIKTNIAKNTVPAKNNKSSFIELFDDVAMTSPEKAARTIEKGMRKKTFRRFIGIDAKFVDRLSRWFPQSYPHLTNRLLGLHGFLKK